MKKLILLLFVILNVQAQNFPPLNQLDSATCISNKEINRNHLFPTKELTPNYRLEVLDPLHRYGVSLQNEWEKFASGKNELSFWSWLDREGTGKRIPQVQFLTSEQRESFKVQFYENKVVPSPSHPNFLKTQAQTQAQAQTQTQALEFIYVMDAQGQFFLGVKNKGSETQKAFQHSSFMAGTPVAGAGIIYLNQQGEVEELYNYSGHYLPDENMMMNALASLQSQGVDLERVKLRFFGQEERVNSLKWLRSLKGRPASLVALP